MSKQFDYSKHSRMLYIVEEHVYLYEDLGIIVESSISYSINGCDEILRCKSLCLNRVRWIVDEP